MRYCYSSKSKVISIEAMLYSYQPERKSGIYNWKPHICMVEKKKGRWDVHYDKCSISSQQKICLEIFSDESRIKPLCDHMKKIIDQTDAVADRLIDRDQAFCFKLIGQYIHTLSDLLNLYSFTNYFLFSKIEEKVTCDLKALFDEKTVNKLLFFDTRLEGTFSHAANRELACFRNEYKEKNRVNREKIAEFIKKYAFLLSQKQSSDIEEYVNALIMLDQQYEDGKQHSGFSLPEKEIIYDSTVKLNLNIITDLRLLRLKMRESMMRMNYYFTNRLVNVLHGLYGEFLSDFEIEKLTDNLSIDDLEHLDHLNIKKILDTQISSILCLDGKRYEISRTVDGYEMTSQSKFSESNNVIGDVVYGNGIITGKVVTCYFDNHIIVAHDCVYVTKSLHPKDLLLSSRFKAVIIDEGGVLSHASIIAKEMKIPCITNTGSLSLTLDEGDFVEIDFSSGSVRKIESEKERGGNADYRMVRLGTDVINKQCYGNKCVNLCANINDFRIAEGYVLDWKYVKYLYLRWKTDGHISMTTEQMELLKPLYPVILRSSSSYEDNDSFTGAGLLESVPNVHDIDEFMEALAVVYESSKTKALENYNKKTMGCDNGYVAIIVQRYYHFEILGTALLKKGQVSVEYRSKVKDKPIVATIDFQETTDLMKHAYDSDEMRVLIPQIAKLLEKHFDVIIEFGIYHSEMYLLQIRKTRYI